MLLWLELLAVLFRSLLVCLRCQGCAKVFLSGVAGSAQLSLGDLLFLSLDSVS